MRRHHHLALVGALALGACTSDASSDVAPPPAPSLPTPDAPCTDVAPSAGFTEVPGNGGTPAPSRLFWILQPADACASKKPLFVVFNGGPGYPTTLGLALRGIGRDVLDDAGRLVPNPASFTALGSVLFVDSRDAGFSYSVPAGRESVCGHPSERDDAEDHLHVLFDVIRQNPALARSRVVLVGESYGGARAQAMLDMVFDPASVEADGRALAAPLREHLAASFGDRDPGVARIGARFGEQVLVQPLVAGSVQTEQSRPLAERDPEIGPALADPGRDHYQLDERKGYTEGRDTSGLAALADPANLARIFGVDPRAIPELLPSGRARARRPDTAPDHVPGLAAVAAGLDAALGAPAKGDRYYDVVPCPSALDWHQGLGTGDAFVRNLARGRVFITNARKDGVIYSPFVPLSLGQGTTVTFGARASGPRPQTFDVALGEAGSRTVRFPTYDRAGHAVAERMGRELADDVAAWLAR